MNAVIVRSMDEIHPSIHPSIDERAILDHRSGAFRIIRWPPKRPAGPCSCSCPGPHGCCEFSVDSLRASGVGAAGGGSCPKRRPAAHNADSGSFSTGHAAKCEASSSKGWFRRRAQQSCTSRLPGANMAAEEAVAEPSFAAVHPLRSTLLFSNVLSNCASAGWTHPVYSVFTIAVSSSFFSFSGQSRPENWSVALGTMRICSPWPALRSHQHCSLDLLDSLSVRFLPSTDCWITMAVLGPLRATGDRWCGYAGDLICNPSCPSSRCGLCVSEPLTVV